MGKGEERRGRSVIRKINHEIRLKKKKTKRKRPLSMELVKASSSEIKL